MSGVRQGDVYWLDCGSAPGSGPAERHPCVVAQSDLFNRSRIVTTAVCLITSNMARANAPGNVALRSGDANLSKDGVVNVSQIITVDKNELLERLGRLPAATVDAIRTGLRLLFDRV